MSDPTRKWYQKWWVWIIGGIVLLLSSVGVALGFAVIQYFNSGSLGQGSATAQGDSLVTQDDPSWGPADATVQIVEFSDFQCPYCQRAHEVVNQILAEFGDQVHFVYRDFPLIDSHPNAVQAALAAECADDQGKFWEMHNFLFEQQRQFTQGDSFFTLAALQVGLDRNRYNDCYSSQKYLQEVENDLNEGYAAGVRATPTFFVNNIKLEGAPTYDAFRQVILEQLSQ